MGPLQDATRLAEQIADHFEVQLLEEEEHVCVTRKSDSDDDELTALLAEDIVLYRVGRRQDLADVWRAQRAGESAGNPLATLLRALVEPATGSILAPRSGDHTEALVAEHLWYALSRADMADLPVIEIWGPSFDVTDPGGDGLVVHGPEELTYRLWEIKKYAGGGHITKTGVAAIRQLRREALKYLARFKQLGEYLPDEQLAELHSHLLDTWLDADPVASAGVSVASSNSAVRTECFKRLPVVFPAFVTPRRLRARANSLADFRAFSVKVIGQIWTGL